MVINMDESRQTIIEQICVFPSAHAAVRSTPQGSDTQRYGHISRVPKCLDCPRRNRQETGIMLHYLRHTNADVALLVAGGPCL